MWAQEVFSAGDKGVNPPHVVNLAKPTYTAAALERRIEGTVKMAAVVLADGKVGDDVKILQSLDQELDELVVVALLQSEFPAEWRLANAMQQAGSTSLYSGRSRSCLPF